MKSTSSAAVACGFLLCLTSMAWAQFAAEEPEWKESEVPPPPLVEMSRLVNFEVSPNASLVYGVDPVSISISKSDGVVRYVVVASNATGARNVMYEGIRCATGEFKTYARYSSEGPWNMVNKPQWQTMFGNMPSKHALRLAAAGVCDNAVPTASVREIVSRLKNPNFRITN